MIYILISLTFNIIIVTTKDEIITKDIKSQENYPLLKAELSFNLFFILDYSVYRSWLDLSNHNHSKALWNLKYFYNLIINGINKKFVLIRNSSYKYIVKSAGWFIDKRGDYFPYSEAIINDTIHLDYELALDKYRVWLSELKIEKDCAVTIIFTKYSSEKFERCGCFETACSNMLAAIVRQRGLHYTILTTLFEIGRLLGADDNSTKFGCNMTLQEMKLLDNHIEHTSTLQFQSHIKSLDHCFKNNKEIKVEFINNNLINILPGLVFDLNNQCQHSFGTNSHYCIRSILVDNDYDMCSELSCLDHATKLCTLSMEDAPYLGTPCGFKSRCIGKKCIYNDNLRDTKQDECKTIDDFKGKLMLRNNYYRCVDVRMFPGLCYYKEFQDNCCRICMWVSFGRQGDCKYGDWHARIKFKNLFGTRVHSCSFFQNQQFACYDPSFRKLCCATCSDLQKSSLIGCEYGDRAINCKTEYRKNKKLCLNKMNKEKCCDTCRQYF